MSLSNENHFEYWEGERVDTYPNFGQYIVLAREMEDGSELTIENAYHWGEISRQKKLLIVIDLSSFKTVEERETIVSEFVSAMIDVDMCTITSEVDLISSCSCFNLLSKVLFYFLHCFYCKFIQLFHFF